MTTKPKHGKSDQAMQPKAQVAIDKHHQTLRHYLCLWKKWYANVLFAYLVTAVQNSEIAHCTLIYMKPPMHSYLLSQVNQSIPSVLYTSITAHSLPLNSLCRTEYAVHHKTRWPCISYSIECNRITPSLTGHTPYSPAISWVFFSKLNPVPSIPASVFSGCQL